MHIVERLAFGSNLNCLDLLGSAVEVGVLDGDFSATFAAQWKGQRLYLLDRWQPHTYVDYCNRFDANDWARKYAQVQQRFIHDPRVTLIADNSVPERSHGMFDEEQFDFVYLDADHSYEAVVRDIAYWWPRVANNGILAGHDYVNAFWGNPQADPHSTWSAVKSAVDHVFHDSMILATWKDHVPSWAVFKFTKPHPDDIHVVSLSTPNLSYAKETRFNHQQYCQRHGYRYTHFDDVLLSDCHPAWSKLVAILQVIADAQWVVWVDADAVFVNHDIDLQRFCIPRMGHVSSTWCVDNTLRLTNGVSLWQNCDWTVRKLHESLSYRHHFAFSGVWEEEGIHRAITNDLDSYGLWLGVELHHFNAWPHYNAWHNHDASKSLIHHWGGVAHHKDMLIRDSLFIATYRMSQIRQTSY